jgi:hypothetical protein
MTAYTTFQLNSVYRHDGQAPAMWLATSVIVKESGRPIRS